MLPDLKSQPVFDEKEALVLLEEDRELLSEVVDLFIEVGPECLDEIQSAADDGDLDRMRQAAHALHGSAANVCAQRICLLAGAMEECTESGSLGSPELVSAIHDEFERFCNEAHLTP